MVCLRYIFFFRVIFIVTIISTGNVFAQNTLVTEKNTSLSKSFTASPDSVLIIYKTATTFTNTATSSGTWETAGNWSLGHAPLNTEDVVVPAATAITINSAAVCASLTIVSTGQLTINSTNGLTIGGSLQNDGTFTAGANTTLTFNGTINSTVTGSGTFTINYIVLNLSSKTTVLDIQSNNFITGINSAAGYNFTFTCGTFKYNNTATLTNCHDNGSATALTIPFNVIIESDLGTLNLCPNGTNNSVILSGKLYINGGTVNVQNSQVLNSGYDFVYQVNGGTPQLYVNSGTLSIGSGFHAKAGTDYIDFNMTGGNIILADQGMSLSYTFQLANVTGGSTTMTGGTIVIQDACNANFPDIDMGGANVSPYNVTGGTIQFGNPSTQGGSTYFGIKPNGAHNYPNLDFQSGIAKSVSAWGAGDFSVISIYICASMTFNVSGTNPNITFTGTNGTFALNNSGTFNMGTGTFTFNCSATSQLVTGTSINFSNVVINNTNGVIFQMPTTITGTLTLTNGNLLIMSNTITFQDGNIPIARTTGTMSYNSTANLVFGTPGHTGGAAFTIPAGTFLSGASLDGLTINRTNSLSLGEDMIVRGTLTMTSGKINLAGHTLTIGTAPGTPGTLSHAGVAASGWIYGGSLVRYFGTASIADRNVAGMFPMGSSTDFRPFYVSYPAAVLTSGGTITLTHTNANTTADVNFADGGSTVIRRSDSYWTCSAGGGMAAAGTPFNLSAEGTGLGLVTDVLHLRLTLAGSVTGTDGAHSGTTTNPQVNRTGLSLVNLSNNFYMGSINTASPLPISLLSFEAVCNGERVNLNWKTASETNNDFFTVYKSEDAVTWIELSSIPGAGNSNQMKDYTFADSDYHGNIAYYQLKQTDYDGSATWFNVSAVDCFTGSFSLVQIYPNPFSTSATIMINDISQIMNCELRIYNGLGEEVMNTNVTKQFTTLETSSLPSGIYFYNVINNNKTVQSGRLVSLQ